MAIPDQVLFEPRATGALRVELFGNTAAAGAQLGRARVLLGALRSMYGVNERLAAGEPGGFYLQRQVLPDGTLIEVSTNGGFDMVRIQAPPARRAAPRSAPPQRRWGRTKSVLAAGTYFNFMNDSTYIEAYLWRENDAGGELVPVETPPLAPIWQNNVAGVSANGEVAGWIGYFDADGNSGTAMAYVWTEQGGTELLGDAAAPHGISGDGTVLVGGTLDGSAPGPLDMPCCWVLGSDGYRLQMLPRPAGPFELQTCVATGASFDGSVMVGYAGFADSPPNGPSAHGVVRWERQADGALEVALLYSRERSVLERAGIAGSAPIVSPDGSTVAWDSEDLGIPLIDDPSSRIACCWDAVHGIQIIDPGSTYTPAGLSYGGQFVYIGAGGDGAPQRWLRDSGADAPDGAPRAGAIDAGGGHLTDDISAAEQAQLADSGGMFVFDQSVEAYVADGQIVIARGGVVTAHDVALPGPAVFDVKLAIATMLVPATPPLSPP